MSLEINLDRSGIFDKPDGEPESVDAGGHRHWPRKQADNSLFHGEIEERDYRRRFQETEGEFSITLEPGEAPGAFKIEVHYEGPYRENWEDTFRGQLCDSGQRKLLKMVSQWLRDTFGDAAGLWEVTFKDIPHPAA